MLEWHGPDRLDEVGEGEVILISNNRGTWMHEDPARNNCVVVTRYGHRFSQFGPDEFDVGQIAAWARFNPPPAQIVAQWPRVYLDYDFTGKNKDKTLLEVLAAG